MNIHEFYQKKAIGFIIVVIVFIIGYFVFSKISPKNQVNDDLVSSEVVNEIVPTGKPVLTWDLQYTDETEYPETTLSLKATYENDVIITKEIDTAQGSCNVYDNPKKEVIYEKSEMIICYFAGLGHYYKIVENQEGKYDVQRRIFEEGSPDHNPPVLPFETIVQF